MPPTIGNVTVLGKSGPTSTWYPDQVFTGQHNNNGNYVYFVGWWWYNDPNVMPTVTYGGQSMTNVYWQNGMWGLSRAFGVWELANAPTGVNNVVVSCDHDGLSALAYVALSVQNVTAPRGDVAVADGLFTSDDPAINVASTTGDLVIDMLFANSHDNNTLLTGIPGTGQTSVFTNDYVFPNSPMFGGISTKEAGGSTTPMAWDLSGGDGVWTFRHIGFALSGGVPGLTQYTYRWAADDAPEGSNTPLASADTPVTSPVNQRIRLIVGVDASGDPPSQGLRLEWSYAGENIWRRVRLE